MRFAIVGAGATGGYLGACLARSGLEVTLIARGPHLAAMRERGLKVLEADDASFTTHPDCTDRLDAITSADMVFVTLKAHSLPGMAPALASAAGKQSTFVFAQNGVPWWFFLGSGDDTHLESVDPGGVIASSFPAERVLGCVAYPATTLVEPGVVRHIEGNRFSLGELDGTRTDRVRSLSSALMQAGLKAPVQTRLRQEIWLKLLGNATLNPVSALTRATLSELLDDEVSRDLLRRLMLEVETVGKAYDLQPDISVDRRLEGAARVGNHRTSMLQDVEAGRPLEVEALVGSVIEMGRRRDVSIPALEVVYQLTRQLNKSLPGA
ncbi:MAG TPA: 2-dehydropantoate 2-reductase [Ktedonobacteraceae bacterium]|nr:2-dehydropantoate 2-reductase [Ktedonobacteraceae bacterium]